MKKTVRYSKKSDPADGTKADMMEDAIKAHKSMQKKMMTGTRMMMGKQKK